MALLAQSGRIEIIVRREGGAGSGNAGAKTRSAEEGTQTLLAKLTGTDDKSAQRNILWSAGKELYSTSKEIALQRVNAWAGDQGYYHGDASYQDLVQRNIERINDTSGTAVNVAMATIVGASTAGGLGAIVGFATSAISSGNNLILKYIGRQIDYNVKIFKQENEIEYLRARASINFTTGRLR